MTGLQTDRTALHRLPERGSHDRAVIDPILDEAYLCHLGFTQDGQPFVIPTIHARVGDVLYLHGSAASRAMRTAKQGIPVCITVTLLDGLVLARSAFHHSVNYRSVMVLGTATEVTDRAEKAAALDAIVDHVLAGRSADARPGNDKELRATTVLRIPLTEASAKVRTGGPKDDPEDMDLPVWAGVLPVKMVHGGPERDPASEEAEPGYLTRPRR